MIAAKMLEPLKVRSVKGSHHVFTHPSRPGHLTVPHPKKDLGKGLG
jgi:predicted RNA binding protein YcfA (HicA-like mRNA interferase family)